MTRSLQLAMLALVLALTACADPPAPKADVSANAVDANLGDQPDVPAETDAPAEPDVADAGTDSPDVSPPEPDSGSSDSAAIDAEDSVDSSDTADVATPPPPPGTPCDNAHPCAGGQVCDPIAHVCLGCITSADCGQAAVVCADHECVAGCVANVQCSGGSCNFATGECKPAAKSCTQNADCPGVCDLAAGQCVGCLLNGDCKAEQFCDGPTQACHFDYCKANVCAASSYFACVVDGSGYTKAIGCEDGDLCTTDSCQGEGECVHLPGALTCVDGNVCTVDSCHPKIGCQFNPAVGMTCDDGNPCTQADACSDGFCAPGLAKVCDDSNPCTKDACDASGQCAFTPQTAVCDDGNACTTADACSGGACQGQPVDAAKTCDDKNVCTTDTCIAASGCEHAASSGGVCDDGNSCSGGDTCAGGACKPGVTALCSCQTDANCPDDGNACNGSLFCDKAAFPYSCKVKAGSIVSCSTSGDTACATAACNPGSGACSLVNAADGTLCADGSVCTLQDGCKSGKCTGSLVTCNDGNACTTDSCEPTLGCQFKAADGGGCDDGNACTTADVCKNSACGGTAKNCADGNGCTADACDGKLGCQNAPAAGGCDDGNPCTLGDACQAGSCGAGPGSKVCDDGEKCTDDSCDAKLGCVFKPSASAACAPGFSVQAAFISVPDTSLGAYRVLDQGWLRGDKCGAGFCVSGGFRP